jgi:16S rRNA (uracil1498-N3)-methyltransferase
MPKVPAWPPRSTPRLYWPQELAVDARVEPDRAQARYLLQVMRRGEGDPVRLFDDIGGEFLGRLRDAGRSSCILEVTQHLATREKVPDLWLCAAPIHKDNFAHVAEKSAELGVRRFVPTPMQRCQRGEVKADRLMKRMIEAAEQCERTALPELADAAPLTDLLADWPQERALFFCDETGGEPAMEAFAAHDGPAAILIGPEGGFDPAERDAVLALPQARGITLGPRILRAETAAIAACALWMAVAGDWSGEPRA